MQERKDPRRDRPWQGWKTNSSLAKEIKAGEKTIRKVANEFRDSHPDWFRFFPVARFNVEHYHPALIILIGEKVNKMKEKAPEGWMGFNQIMEKFNVSSKTLLTFIQSYRLTHPEWFNFFADEKGHRYEHYHPDFIALIQKDKEVRTITVESIKKELTAAHAKWKGANDQDKSIHFNTNWLRKNGCEDVFGWLRRRGIDLAGFFRENLPEIGWDFEKNEVGPRITKEFAKGKIVEAHKKWKEESSDTPFNIAWLASQGLQNVIAWVNRNFESFSNFVEAELSDQIQNDFAYEDKKRRTLEEAQQEMRQAFDLWKKEGIGKFNVAWLTHHGYKPLYRWVESHGGMEGFLVSLPEIAEKFEKKEIFTNRYTKEAALQRFEEAHALWKTQGSNGKFTVSWMSRNGFKGFVGAITGGIGFKGLVEDAPEEVRRDFILFEKAASYDEPKILEFLVEAHLQWKNSCTSEPFSPYWLIQNGYQHVYKWAYRNLGGINNLVEKSPLEVKTDFSNQRGVGEKEKKDKAGKQANVKEKEEATKKHDETQEEKKRKKQLRDQLKETAKKIADGSSPDTDQIRKLIAFFGESSVVDIIFQLHPEFKDIDIEVARGILGEYLGNFLNVRGAFNPEDLKLATEFLGNIRMAAILKEALKRRCLEFYYKTRKINEGMTDNEIVYAYFEYMVKLADQIGNPTFSEITLEVSVYFEGLFEEIKKPTHLVDSIVEGRAFPDINQRVNTQELREKKRLYIADEMGLGKSASAIFAKETLGCKTAVLVVPKGLIPTWKRYLSDDKSKGGYFKPGLAPKVLVVENTRQIQAGISGYGYVIVAQEKMNERDVESIKLQNPDMLIVDEMHKLKKPKGKRSDKVLDLATAFKGEDKYLALLSGTPIPNTVRDLAVTIKILYPEEEAAGLDPRIIATSLVIPGNVKVGKLRGRLLERMQMKRLEDSIEMPPKTEIVIPVELGEMQTHLYEAAVEQDEIEGSLAKMDLLSKVLLNPRILDTTPGIENAKQRMLEMTLRDSLKRHNKIVVFVNHQVDGVLRGDFTILDEIDLGPDVKIHRIHGDVKDKHRDEIQQHFQTSEDKEVVFIFGRVSDVGVDFSHGQAVYFYNDPWTQYDKNQQIARVWRPGVRGPVEVGTLRVPGTIDEGLAFHIEAKYKVVEKILRGIPLSEVDKRVALSDDGLMETPEADVNPELAKYYYNAWKRMLKMFIHHREQGEEKFKEFLEKYGAEYARSYIDLSARSYQANVNRFAGTLIGKMIEQQPGQKVIVDMASGPDMLRRHMIVPRDTRIISVDLNPLHFQQLDSDHLEASFTAMPIQDESVDFCNLALALHYTRYVPTKGDLERLNVFREMNRVLKVGGRAVISELYSLEMKDPTKFEKLLDIFGFEIVTGFSGRASSVPSFSDVVITIEKKRSVPDSVEDLQNKIKEADLVDGLKFKETEVDSKLKDVKMVVIECVFNGQKIKVNLNETDEVIRNEEQTIIKVARDLIRQYGGIGQIPREEVIRNGFARWSPGEEEVEGEPKVKRGKRPKKRKYLLFRKLHSGPGIVMLKG